MPSRPASMPSHEARVPTPRDVTRPTPVTATRDIVPVWLGHRGGGALLPVLPESTVVVTGRAQALRVVDQVPEDVLPVEVHAEREIGGSEVAQDLARPV